MNLQQRTVLGRAAPEPEQWRIKLHGADGFAGMRKAGRLAAEVLDFITPSVVPGATTDQLDRRCHGFIVDHGAIPAPLNYRGFPRSICTSINHVVCHGIPGERKLDEGDILNIDITVILDGWHGDTSRMFLVGDKVPLKARRLVEVTWEAMMRGIEAVRPGVRAGSIGHAIQSVARRGAFRWCGTSAATASDASSTTRPRSCISARPGKGRSCARACSSPSSR